MALEPWNFAQAAQQTPRAIRAIEVSGAEQALARFDSSLQSARNLAVRPSDLSARGEEDLSPGLAALESRFQEISAADSEIQADFDQIGKRLEAAHVPQEILKRHQAAVADYRANLARLRGEIETSLRLHDEWKQAKGKSLGRDAQARYLELRGKLGEMSIHLRDKVKDPRHTALDPHRLPHRRADLPRQEPRLKAADFAALAGALGAPRSKVAQAPVLGLGTKAALPGPDDLGETPEVRLTPEIRALAAQLGNDPTRIYGYVRDQIDFVPTHGSIQGASMCLSTHRCNDLDIASLLIALLRAAGVPARYAVGTVEVPIAKIQNWVGGFTDPMAALNFISSSGTPATALTSGGVPVAARMEHAWVETFVDYIPSRGASHGPGDTWVPLDPSFKQFTYKAGIDLAAATGGFDDVAFFTQVATGATVNSSDGSVTGINAAAVDQKLLELKGQIATYAQSQGIPPKLDDFAGGRAILTQRLAVLPDSLPYRVLVRGAGFARVPDALRHSLQFEVTSAGGFIPDLTYTASLPELAGKKITLSYSPATAADEATLRSLLPTGDSPTPSDFPSTIPAYLIHVRPELRIEGALVATGTSSTLGTRGQFSLVFDTPGSSQERVDNDITAGTYNALVLNLGLVENAATRQAALRAQLDRLKAGDASGITKDNTVGEFLYDAGLLYWSELELFDRVISEAKAVVVSRLPSEGIFTSDLKVSSLFGVPRVVSSGALLTDVDLDIQAVFSRQGDPKQPADFLAVTGAVSSRAESAIYDQITHNGQPTGQGITAVSYLEAAARQGIPIFHITRDNLAAALPALQVSSSVKADIENSVNAGMVATIPQRGFIKDGFDGIGYIVFDLQTGAGGYLISGGLAGGGFEPEEPSSGPIKDFLFAGLLSLVGMKESLGKFISVITFVSEGAGFAANVIKYRDDPNLTPDQVEAILGFLGALSLINVLLAAAGPVLGPEGALVLAVYSLYFSFISVVASGVLDFYLPLFDRRTTEPFARISYTFQRGFTLAQSLPLGIGAAK